MNRTVLLECPVSGVPPPKVRWLKNGEVLSLRQGLRLLAGGRQVELFRAQVNDTARYTCIAVNEAGELRRNFDLEVLGEVTAIVVDTESTSSMFFRIMTDCCHRLMLCDYRFVGRIIR